MTTRPRSGGTVQSLENQLRLINRFPDQNPNPVMRVASDDGTLTYANAASAPILDTIRATVGEPFPAGLLAELRHRAAAGQREALEVACDTVSYSLLPVAVPELGFINVYGTDVTAAKVFARFPDRNPNPVFRVTPGGELSYANAASQPIIRTLNARLGAAIDGETHERIVASAFGRGPASFEVYAEGRVYALFPVMIPEFDLINVYGTDVTAAKVFARFPDRNPNPVFRVTPGGELSYANAASEPIIRALGIGLGDPLPDEPREQILASMTADQAIRFEIEGDGRLFALYPVHVPEFDVVNVYATDITAARAVEIAHRENERLLLNILPEPIAARLRGGERVIADRIDDATLLFADIVNFTVMSSRMNPTDVVSLLNEVFSLFDRLVDRYGLEKIKTIGDAYMVVGGLPDQPPNHTERMAEMAIELCREAASLPVEPSLQFRVGIHCGPLVAGVIGVKKFIYDVWGDTVNVASRMESHGIPGRIQVTGAVYERLRDRYRLEARGTVDIRGKGPMPTWFLAGRLGDPVVTRTSAGELELGQDAGGPAAPAASA